MTRPRLVLRLLERVGTDSRLDALIGDLIEEIAGGRSRVWIWRQVLALCGVAALGHVRSRVRATHLVAVALCCCAVCAAWLAPPVKVLQVWISVYYLAGTLSLFFDMVTPRTVESHI